MNKGKIARLIIILFMFVVGILAILVAANAGLTLLGCFIIVVAVTHLYVLCKELINAKRRRLNDFEAALSSKLLAEVKSRGIIDVYIERHRWQIKLCHTNYVSVIDTYLDKSRRYSNQFLVRDLAGLEKYLKSVGIVARLEDIAPSVAFLSYERLENNG